MLKPTEWIPIRSSLDLFNDYLLKFSAYEYHKKVFRLIYHQLVGLLGQKWICSELNIFVIT